jgi:hypothetical protein
MYSIGNDSRSVCLAIVDFNNDSRLDIAVASFGTNNVYIFIVGEYGSFSLFTIYSTEDGSEPKRIYVAGLNRDNQLHIIIPNSDSNNVDILYVFGNHTFSKPQVYLISAGSAQHWVSIAYINNNIWVDLVVANLNINSVGVFDKDGYGYFGNQTTYSSGSNSRPIFGAISDFNKCNRLYIAVANLGKQNLAILLGHLNEKSNINGSNSKNHSNFSIINYINNVMPILLGEYYTDFSNKKIIQLDAVHIGVSLGYNKETFAAVVR